MSSTEQLMSSAGGGGAKYVQMQSETDFPSMASSFYSFHQQSYEDGEPARIFHELPKAAIIQISRPDAGDISPMQLTYTIEFQYKQVSPSILDCDCMIPMKLDSRFIEFALIEL